MNNKKTSLYGLGMMILLITCGVVAHGFSFWAGLAIIAGAGLMAHGAEMGP